MKILRILILISLTSSCVKQADERITKNEHHRTLNNMLIEKDFNFQMSQIVSLEVSSSEMANYIIYEVDPQKNNSKVVAKFNAQDNHKSKLSLSKSVKEILLIRSLNGQTAYHRVAIQDGVALAEF